MGYGMGLEALRKNLGTSSTRAMEIREEYRNKYPRTFEFADNLQYEEERETPLLKRRIRFSEYKEHSKFN